MRALIVAIILVARCGSIGPTPTPAPQPTEPGECRLPCHPNLGPTPSEFKP